MSILLINGPNLNLLGLREPEIYGHETLQDVEQQLASMATEHGCAFDAFQSNHEGAIVDKIHESRGRHQFIIMNPGAFTHTSIAIRDAIAGVAIPLVEIHISNVYARESFRQQSYFSDIAVATIAGMGCTGYQYALLFAIEYLAKTALKQQRN